VIRILVVDDHSLVRAGFAALIRAAPGLEVVGEAADGDEAVASAASTRPDVVLMDIRMPGTNGVVATEGILAEAGKDAPRVLILTTFDLDEYVYAALRAGGRSPRRHAVRAHRHAQARRCLRPAAGPGSPATDTARPHTA
jgi:DNA-binding NarL/FixJ family response regulator